MDTLQIGPFLLQWSWLLLFLSGGTGFLLLHFRLKNTGEARKIIMDAFINALMIAILTWKFSHVLFDPTILLSNPLGLLYFNGGQKGVWIAVLAVLFYFFRHIRKSGIAPILYAYSLFAGITTAVAAYQMLLALYTGEQRIIHLAYSVFFLGLFVWGDHRFKQARSPKERMERMKTIAVAAVLLSLISFGIYERVGQSASIQDTQAGTTVGLKKGDIAPNFTLTTLDGQTLELTQLRGKKVLLNFWATWCPPCRAEMPDMQKFYQTYQNQGIEVVAVNVTKTETSTDSVQNFVQDYGLTFSIPLDVKGEVSSLFEAHTFPTSYLLNEQGRIVEKRVGPMNYDQMKRFAE
ncbi:redoxin domain-containing protein [Aneurinibacillus sp. REN35]|uniref:redoxin domain-containing protein n=1 Tax=Aneurinibacillus sp. REN35 TaxID=3237286 RepID=UPI003528C3F2